MSQGKYYLSSELMQCLKQAKAGDTIKIGSLVDVECKDLSKLLKILQILEQRGVILESVNEPHLNGKPFSKLQNSIAILRYFQGK